MCEITFQSAKWESTNAMSGIKKKQLKDVAWETVIFVTRNFPSFYRSYYKTVIYKQTNVTIKIPDSLYASDVLTTLRDL